MCAWIWVSSALVIGFHAGMILMSMLQIAATGERREAALHIGVRQGHREIGGRL